MIGTSPDQMLPSTPMTSPTPQAQPRRLGPAQQPQQQPMGMGMPQQNGKGESETDFAALMPMTDPSWIPPARPSQLREESSTPTFAVDLMRRHLPTHTGPRRL